MPVAGNASNLKKGIQLSLDPPLGLSDSYAAEACELNW
jgi:hypothetical protein